ncbi:MFS transporter [Neofusicoccum parvum]|uniref:MFS transporter n=2 Tax=Neofusicoccum parvum TaxID=310453 RepID=A0ACB5SLT7_9PEZI|nr:putative mfs transporter protein [Neofusicoccum parvum UCRNP2]GME47726.1 MFS transporter [Neofusicoccum parvum]GME64985.1 MFS transporter [Neofusicoccum parvum]
MEMNHTDKELHEIEEELRTEILPGTEIMRDVGSHHFVKSGDSSHRVLVPQPTDDKHDPLNWTLWWKTSAISVSTYITFVQGFGPLALAPQFEYYMKDFNCSLADAIQFTGICILVLGFSNFIWVPISSSFGRRPVLFFSTLICFASSIWRAEAKSYGSFMGACVVNGIGAGPAETMQPAIIADIFFLHDRGKWNTLYWVAYMGSLMVGPIISGSMALHVGWRSFWWLNTALLGLGCVLVAFLYPESKFPRPHMDDLPSAKTASPAASTTDEKSGAAAIEIADGAAPTAGDGIAQVPTHKSSSGDDLEATPTAQRDPWLGRGTPSKRQWMAFQPNANPWRSIFLDLWVPWKLFAFPIVEFASFVVSWSCSSFLAINLTQAQNFAAPPYLWSSEVIGFTNFAVLVGAFIGLFTAGPLSDWVAAKLTARNGGIREPEMRLPAMIPYVIIMIIGNICVAVGYEHKWHWAPIVVIGYACAGIQVAALPAIASTYAVDSYKPVAGSLFVSITVNKNLWGYGFGKFITPWSEKAGFIAPIMTNCALITLFCLCGIIFYFYGKTFRRWSKNSKVHKME